MDKGSYKNILKKILSRTTLQMQRYNKEFYNYHDSNSIKTLTKTLILRILKKKKENQRQRGLDNVTAVRRAF